MRYIYRCDEFDKPVTANMHKTESRSLMERYIGSHHRMKSALLGLILIMSACSKPPAIAPATRQAVWTDIITHRDTIITNLNNQPPLIYFAKKNWQLSADTNITHGYRFIGIRYMDSILVKGLKDSSTNYQGPFLLQANKSYDTLKAQNFLDTTNTNPVITYTHRD